MQSEHASQLDSLREEHARSLETAPNSGDSEASTAHASELEQLRAEHETTLSQLRASHAAEIGALRLSLESTAASAEATRQADVQALQFQLEQAQAELEQTKSSAAELEAKVERSVEELEEARLALDEAPKAAASAAVRAQDQATETPDLGALEQRLADAQTQLEDTRQALAETQENARIQIDTMSKMQATELESAQEDHQNALRQRDEANALALQELQAKLISVEEDRENLRLELADAQTKAHDGSTDDAHLQALHVAHTQKIYEMENNHRTREDEMQAVSAESGSK